MRFIYKVFVEFRSERAKDETLLLEFFLKKLRKDNDGIVNYIIMYCNCTLILLPFEEEILFLSYEVLTLPSAFIEPMFYLIIHNTTFEAACIDALPLIHRTFVHSLSVRLYDYGND